MIAFAKVTAKILIERLKLLQPNAENEAALEFLTHPELIPLTQGLDGLAGEWFRVCRIRHDNATRAGLSPVGFPTLLTALSELSPDEPIRMATFETAQQFGQFWVEKSGPMIGFVIINRRSPEAERARRDWFEKHLGKQAAPRQS